MTVCLGVRDGLSFGRGAGGFTLIELMITVAIIAILAAVAYPTYSDQVRKTARKEAAGVMLDVAGRLERIRTQTFKYQAIAVDSTKRYTLSLEVADGGGSFAVTATPKGDQVEDRCGEISLSSQGTWTFTKDGNEVVQSECL